MQTSIEIYRYGDSEVEFSLEKNVMVNATEMAKIFGKKVENFTRSEQTESFIRACLKNANSRFISVPNRLDLIDSRKKSGTWMHRILALKFAAWLDPDFELWVYHTIDEFMYGAYRRMEESLRQSAIRQSRIDEIKSSLANNDEYCELQRLELEERQAKYRRSKENRNQLDLFRDLSQN